MIDFTVAFDKLAQFQTADELADFFQSEQVRGFKEAHNACPIANWMSSTTGGNISVADFIIDLDPFGPWEKSTRAMQTFMRRFDSGGYPDLEAEKEVGK